jgi:hypothetical protein
VVEHQRAPRLQVLVAAPQRLAVPPPAAAEAEGPAEQDGAVPPGQVELVHRLPVEARDEALRRRPLPAGGEHVQGEVAAVDVDAGPQVRQQQAPGAARQVEDRLAGAVDSPPEAGQLRPAGAELGPPPGHQAVVPGLGLLGVARHPRASSAAAPAAPAAPRGPGG